MAENREGSLCAKVPEATSDEQLAFKKKEQELASYTRKAGRPRPQASNHEFPNACQVELHIVLFACGSVRRSSYMNCVFPLPEINRCCCKPSMAHQIKRIADQVKNFFATMDQSGDGVINFEEFSKLVQSPMLQFLLSQCLGTAKQKSSRVLGKWAGDFASPCLAWLSFL